MPARLAEFKSSFQTFEPLELAGMIGTVGAVLLRTVAVVIMILPKRN
jgi:hypothetical protein